MGISMNNSIPGQIMNRKIEGHRSTSLTFWDLPFVRIFSGAWLPIAIYLSAYAATTVLGALYFILPEGKNDLFMFLGTLDPAVKANIGSLTYNVLLFSPFVVTPLFALIGMRAIHAAAMAAKIPAHWRQPRVPGMAVAILAVLSIGYCVVQIFQTGSTDIATFLSPETTYHQKILYRYGLFESLSPVFFIVSYGFIPILFIVFLSKFIVENRSLFNALFSTLLFLSFIFIVIILFSKSHILVLAVMTLTAIAISRASFWYVPAFLAILMTVFIATEAFLSGALWAIQPAPPAETAISKVEQTGPVVAKAPTDGSKNQQKPNTGKGQEKNPPPPRPGDVDQSPSSPSPITSPRKDELSKAPPLPEQEKMTEDQAIRYLRYFISKGIFFRMASGFPFYTSVFSDPKERCGIEAHTVRRVLGLPPSECVLPTKVFSVMYPKTTWITGFAPAPAHVSAYGELGLSWSFAVMALIGLCLGALGAITRLGRGPLYVAFGVASCTFAYYLTQLPLVAAFTYGHGLIFLTLPIIVLAVVSALLARNAR